MSFHRTQINRQDWFTLTLVVGVTASCAGAVAFAGWAEGLSQVVATTVFSTILGMFLARTRFSEPMALLLSSMYGLFYIGFVNAAMLAPALPWRERVVELGLRLGGWFEAAFTGGTSHDNLVFVVFLSMLFWYLGHNTAWHTFRLDRLGRAVTPPGVVLLVNNFYYQGPLRLEAFLFAYLMLVLLLAVHSHLEARRFEWRFHGVQHARRAAIGFFRAGLMLALALFLVAWTLPAVDNADRERFLEQWREGPLATINETLNRLFADLERQTLTTVEYYGADELPLGGPVTLGDGVVMYVESEAPEANRFYWRSRLYDAYDGRAWDAEGNARSRAPAGAVLGMPQYLGQQRVFQSITWVAPARSGLVYVAQEPYQLGLAAELDIVLIAEETVSASAIFPDRPLRIGDYYEALSLVTRASPSALRVAGVNYPAWVVERYLRLPPTVTQRTRDLALQIVNAASASTPYDQALAIEDWLRREIRYDQRVGAPPPDRADFVDWALFEQRAGYCTTYASAMAVMLRSLGVPTRFVAGFAQGEWDAPYQRYVVRESDAHTWVEVFFPGYGWVEFEPTANRALPRSAALPTPTPTPAVTLTPAADGDSAGAGLTPAAGPEATLGAIMAAATPTLPTVTPTDAPLPPLQSGTTNPEATPPAVGPLLFLILVVIVSVVLMGLLIPWWIEARGLNGLSPIAKAYARLHRYGAWLGLRPRPSETPFERGQRLMQTAPQASRAVEQITGWYNVERYRRAPAARAETVRRTWGRARRALIRLALARRLRRR